MMYRPAITLLLLGSFASSLLPAEDNEMPPDHIEFFESRIRPVLMEHCLKCHGGEKVKKGLQVNTLKALFAGGDSGPALKPGDPHNSLIMQALQGKGDMEPMPPRNPMPASVIADFEKWIAIGAPWPNPHKDPEGINTGTLDVSTGRIRDFGGSTALAGVGVGEYAIFGRIAMRAAGTGLSNPARLANGTAFLHS